MFKVNLSVLERVIRFRILVNLTKHMSMKFKHTYVPELLLQRMPEISALGESGREENKSKAISIHVVNLKPA